MGGMPPPSMRSTTSTSLAITSDESGATVSTLFEGVVFGEVKPSGSGSSVAPCYGASLGKNRLNIVLKRDTLHNRFLDRRWLHQRAAQAVAFV